MTEGSELVEATRVRLALAARRVAETEDRVAEVLERMAARGGSMAGRRLSRARAARQFAAQERALSNLYDPDTGEAASG